MATVVKKLLLVRKKHMRSDLIKQAGLSTFSKGEPLAISPIQWDEQAGVSHYGFVLEGMKLKDLEALAAWYVTAEGTVLLDLNDTVEKTLADQVGLRINSLA